MERPCDACGNAYEAKRPASRFCSATCRKRASRSGAAVVGHIASGLEPEPEPEPESESEPEARGDASWDAALAKVDRSFTTYQRAIERELGDDAEQYVPCPLCLATPRGFVHPAEAGRVPAEQADIVKHFLGLARPVDYPASSQHRRCQECDGLGKVATGSAVAGKETIMCGVCSGNGFVGPAPLVPLAAANGSEGVTGPSVFGAETLPADRDEWDQPRLLPNGHDNPNYGRMPNHWIQVEPWGDTRGLTAQDAVAR